jgi:Tfp pilus assembly protein PilO
MRSSGRLIVSILVLVGLAVAFWVIAISPQREEADRLGTEVEQLTSSVEAAHSEVAAATAAKQSFPADYRQLVVLGQAAPAGDETASLLVELEGIANSSGVEFKSIQLNSAGGEAPVAEVPAATPAPEESGAGSTGAVQAAATIPPTELAASLLPLGASIGPTGLYVMPYTLEFSGGFFQITRFISKVDDLVKTSNEGIAVDGRLITIGGFSLDTETAGGEAENSGGELSATLSVTTFLSPPGQGVTAGATPSSPAPATAESPTTVSTPETSTEGTESSAGTSETVSAK